MSAYFGHMINMSWLVRGSDLINQLADKAIFPQKIGFVVYGSFVLRRNGI
jgi:hypothetical protein